MERIRKKLQDSIRDNNKIVIFDKKEYLQEFEMVSNEREGQIVYVESNEIKAFKSLYFLYEFSDNILMISKEISNYPNIFNFVKAGLLTKEEAYEGLLYQSK